MKTDTSKHAWFFTAIKRLPEYDQLLADEIRADIIFAASRGETHSLKQLYEQDRIAYNRLHNELTNRIVPKYDRRNKLQRKLIAIIHRYIMEQGLTDSELVVNKLAEKVCHVHHLNDASEQQLIVAIRSFALHQTLVFD